MSKCAFLFQSTHFRSVALSQLVFQQHDANHFPLTSRSSSVPQSTAPTLIPGAVPQQSRLFVTLSDILYGTGRRSLPASANIIVNAFFGSKTTENFQPCLVDYLLCTSPFPPSPQDPDPQPAISGHPELRVPHQHAPTARRVPGY